MICYVKMVILEKKMQNDKRDSLLSVDYPFVVL